METGRREDLCPLPHLRERNEAGQGPRQVCRINRSWFQPGPRRRAPNHHRVGESGADLRNANLYGADLHTADPGRAHLANANLIGADLRYAILCYANLRGASLHYANPEGVDLTYANLYGTELCGADLSMATMPD